MKLKTKLFYLIRNNLFYKNWYKFYQDLWKLDPTSCQLLLRDLLVHARENVPYYKDKIPFDNKPENLLSQIPILRKNQIRLHFENLKSTKVDLTKISLQSSGGSTGKPITLVIDNDYSEWLIASENYYYKKYMGFLFAEPTKIILWGAHRDIKQFQGLRAKVSHYLSNITLLNAFEISDRKFDEFIEIINSTKPVFLRSFAGSLFLLAKYIKEKNIKVFKPKFIGTSAETLRPFMRELIEEVFETRVRDYYGSREVGIIAAECRKGKMHTLPFFNHVEVVDGKGDSVKPGEEGVLLVTGLKNYSMPLIRYEIGDTAVLGSSCDCGGDTPVLEKVTGRITDHFVTSTGKMVHGQYFTRLFYFSKWVGEFQILQKDFNLIEIQYVPTNDPSQMEIEEINIKVRKVMGNECEINWVKMDSIPPNAVGKRLFTRSFVFEQGMDFNTKDMVK